MAKKGVFIPQEAWDWLMGLGDSFEPGPDAIKICGKVAPYWWRSELRRRIAAATRKPARASTRSTHK